MHRQQSSSGAPHRSVRELVSIVTLGRAREAGDSAFYVFCVSGGTLSDTPVARQGNLSCQGREGRALVRAAAVETLGRVTAFDGNRADLSSPPASTTPIGRWR